MHSRWRRAARPIIARVIKEAGTEDRKKLRKALSDAYPFGEKRYHPYTVWLDEIKRQLGEKPALGIQGDPKVHTRPCEGQQELF